MTDLLYEKRGHVATITLNRPERMNAISMEMLGQLGEALVDADDDAEIRVILITGQGRGFCSGLVGVDIAVGVLDVSGDGIAFFAASALLRAGSAAHVSEHVRAV